MKKTIAINVEASERIPLSKLEPFQGTLKHIGKAQYEKLRKVLIEQGFSFSVHVWKNEGKVHIIDGHQRIFTLKHMQDSEGFKIPDIPVSVVKAGSFREAKLLVLSGASQYGTMDRDGLYAFMHENEIPFDDIVASFDFPEIDFGAFNAEFFDDTQPAEDDKSEFELPTPPSGSLQVKQLQLFFSADHHSEFLEKIDDLMKSFGTENVTDTVMECVREIHQARATVSR